MYRIATCALVGTGTSAFQQLSLASNSDQVTVSRAPTERRQPQSLAHHCAQN